MHGPRDDYVCMIYYYNMAIYLPEEQCLEEHYVLRFRGRTLFFSRQKDFDFFCLRIQK